MNEYRCFFCSQTGHMSKDCPTLKQYQRQQRRLTGMALGMAMAAMLAGCASTPKPEGIPLTAEQSEVCDRVGCYVITRPGLAALLNKAAEAGRQTCSREQAL